MLFNTLILFIIGAVLVLGGCVQGNLTSTQKIQILNVFNQARRTTLVPAADMKIMEWDDGIASEMQTYTDACVNDWEEFWNPPAFFAYRDHAADPVGVAAWRTLRMAPYYDYLTGQCQNTTMAAKICRYPQNYEAVVYAENEKVGCGMTNCFPQLGPKGVFHACAIGVVPLATQPRYAWTAGPRCSQCPDGFPFCLNGLCSKHNATSTPSAAPVTSRPSRSPTAYPSRAPTGTRAPGTTVVAARRKRRHG